MLEVARIIRNEVCKKQFSDVYQQPIEDCGVVASTISLCLYVVNLLNSVSIVGMLQLSCVTRVAQYAERFRDFPPPSSYHLYPLLPFWFQSGMPSNRALAILLHRKVVT